MTLDAWKWCYGIGLISIPQILQNGKRKISVDVNPFSKAESHFTDAKFYIEQQEPQEVMPIKIASLGKSVIIKKEQMQTVCSFKETYGGRAHRDQWEPGWEGIFERKVICYIAMSRRKKGKSLFAQCGGDEGKTNLYHSKVKVDKLLIKEWTSEKDINDSKTSSVPFLGFEKSP